MTVTEFEKLYSCGVYFSMKEDFESYTFRDGVIYNHNGVVVCYEWEIRRGKLITWIEVFNRKIKLETELTEIFTKED